MGTPMISALISSAMNREKYRECVVVPEMNQIWPSASSSVNFINPTETKQMKVKKKTKKRWGGGDGREGEGRGGKGRGKKERMSE